MKIGLNWTRRLESCERKAVSRFHTARSMRLECQREMSVSTPFNDHRPTPSRSSSENATRSSSRRSTSPAYRKRKSHSSSTSAHARKHFVEKLTILVKQIKRTRWLYCVECSQYSIRLEVLGCLCTSCLLSVFDDV